mgnify:CR=1 FL=1
MENFSDIRAVKAVVTGMENDTTGPWKGESCVDARNKSIHLVSLSRTTEGFYDTALNEASDV